MKKLGLKDILWFGKYEGKNLRWVLENDPSYILWLDRGHDSAKPSARTVRLAEEHIEANSEDPYEGMSIWDFINDD